jgi:hypothetical protein
VDKARYLFDNRGNRFFSTAHANQNPQAVFIREALGKVRDGPPGFSVEPLQFFSSLTRWIVVVSKVPRLFLPDLWDCSSHDKPSG